jgi:hypothetical protein
MRHESTTSPCSPTHLAKLARCLAEAEATYERTPTRRNLTRVALCYQDWYWLNEQQARDEPSVSSVAIGRRVRVQ